MKSKGLLILMKIYSLSSLIYGTSVAFPPLTNKAKGNTFSVYTNSTQVEHESEIKLRASCNSNVEHKTYKLS